MRIILIVVSIILYYLSFAQSSFVYWETGSQDETPLGIYENQYEDIFISIVNHKNLFYNHPRIIKLDKSGNVVDSITIYCENYHCLIDEMVTASDTSILSFGVKNCDSVFSLWILVMDFDLNIIKSIDFPLTNQIISNIYSEKRIGINYNLSFTIGSSGNTSICIMEITNFGEIVSIDYLDEGGQFNIVNEFINDTSQNIYKLFSYNPLNKSSCNLTNIDYELNIINSKFFDGFLLHGNSAKFINSRNYFLSGMQFSTTTNHIDMGLYKINDSDSVKLDQILGNPNVNEYLNKDNLSFTNPNNVFFTGTSNVSHSNLQFSNSPSEILIYLIDSNLNVKQNHFYGGDACYFVFRSLATLDGGLIITASRYDHLTQNLERDPYILKVDSNGLITSISDPTQNTINSNKIILYPNPTQSYINLEIPKSKELSKRQLIIYNIYGTKLDEINMPFDQNQIRIDVRDYSNGLYFVKLISKNKLIQSSSFCKI